MRMYQVDAFTDRLFAGNPAAVLVLDDWLPDELMLAITQENNLAETAFVKTRPDGAWDLRWFAPAHEVDFCGHATLATAHVLFTKKKADALLVFHTRVGELRVSREPGGYRLDIPRLTPEVIDTLPQEIAGIFAEPPVRIFRNFENIFADLGSADAVRSFVPDLAAIARLGPVGLVVTGQEAEGAKAHFVSRYFAPGAGIPEDPVTGSIHATLVPYWAVRLDRVKLMAYQASARGGWLDCELTDDRVILGGNAVTFMEATISLPSITAGPHKREGSRRMKFDTSMKTGTFVTFPGGALAGQGRIEFAAPCANGWLVIADRTPVHPVSFRWPDQPADLGQITFADGVVVEIADAWTGLVDAGAGVLLIGEEAKAVRKGEGEWQGVVIHIAQSDRDLSAYIGEEARFTVEPRRRKALSVPHTVAHLAALALNAASVPFWTKDFADLDALGRPNLDKAAIENSSIEPAVSTDVYRLGRSLKKKGFDRDGFLNKLETVGVEINGLIRRWLKTNTLVSLTPSEGLLDGIRQWRCNLDGTEVNIPCGGTHVERLSDIGDVKITLAPSEDGFVMTTHAREA